MAVVLWSCCLQCLSFMRTIVQNPDVNVRDYLYLPDMYSKYSVGTGSAALERRFERRYDEA